MKLQVIQLEPYDDFVSVRDRLSFIRADRVLLVWPSRGSILSRKLDLILIQRAATQIGMRLALVTHDPLIIENAADLNISTFPSIDAGSTIRWRRPHNSAFVEHGDPRLRPADQPDRYELMEAASRLRRASPEQRQRRQLTRAITAIILAATLLSALYIVAPWASVRIYPARDQLTTTVQLVADPTIAIENVASGHIPATLVQDIVVEREASIPATGIADVPATIATGTVTFTNNTTDPVVIPVGTIITTLNGVHPARFHTVNEALIDASGTVDVAIEALPDSGGPDGNIEANLITNLVGDLTKSLSVRNAAPTSGGTVRQQKIVTQADQDKLLKLVRDQIRTTSVADIKLTPTQFIAPGSIQIVQERPDWTTYSAFVGDAADTLTLTLRARIQALIVDELPARKVAYANLARQLQNRQIVVDSVVYRRDRVDPIDKDGRATFLLTASADAVSGIDADGVRAAITGVGVTDAAALLQRTYLLDPRRPPQIDVLPAFFGRLPVLPIRIEITIAP